MTTVPSASPPTRPAGTTIRVGWRLDGAPWLPAQGAALDSLVTGPDGLLDLVAARLGLATQTRPNATERILAYRTVLLQRVAAGEGAWYRESLAIDSWGTTATLLTMRDSLIGSGWSPTAPATEPPDGTDGVRLAALRDAELALPATSPVRRGRADLLIDVTTALGECPWPLGIGAVTLDEPLEALPECWQRLLTALAPHVGSLATGTRDRAGTGLTGPDDDGPHEHRPALTVLTAETSWEMAEATARHLHALAVSAPEAAAATVLLATQDTHELDAALAHRGLPAAGVTGATAPRGSARLLTLAVDALIGSVSMPSLVSLIDWHFVPDARAIGTQPRLLPAEVSRPLLGALGSEPGASRDPASAWAIALDQVAKDSPDSAPLVERLTGLIETAAVTGGSAPTPFEDAQRSSGATTGDDDASVPGPAAAPLDLDHVLAVLDWLADALGAQDRRSHDAGVAAAHVASVRTALREHWGGGAPTRRDLTSLINATAEATTRPGPGAQAAPWRVLRDPAHLAALAPGAHVVWWGAADPIERLTDPWDAAEREALDAAGVQPATPGDLASLEAEAGLAGLASAADVVALMRRAVDGTPQAPHPLLARLARGTKDAEPRRLSHLASPSSAQPKDAQDAQDAAGPVTWALTDGAATIALAPRPALRPAAPNAFGRRVEPGTLTVTRPEAMSYTQISTLLAAPLRWVLQYGFGLREGRIASVPTGSAMIGTFLHALVQRLVNERDGRPAPVPTATEVGAAFDEMCPCYALELLGPGRGAERRVVREQACESVVDLFALLERLDATELASEQQIDFPIDLAPRPDRDAPPTAVEADAGPDSAPSTPTGAEEDRTDAGQNGPHMTGRVDLAGRVGDASLVIDLKWTGTDKYFREAVVEGRDLQLAVYATAQAHAAQQAFRAGATSAAEAAVGYYMLRQNRLITDSNILDPDAPSTGPQRERLTALWTAAAATARDLLSDLEAGTVPVGTAGLRLLIDGGLSGYKSPTYASTIAEMQAAARDHDRVLVEDTFPHTPYRVLEGLAGD